MRAIRMLAAGVAVALCGAALPAQTADRAMAERATQKLEAIAARPLLTPVPKTPLRTTITDSEINAYFQVYGEEQLPPGLKQVRVTMHDAGRFESRVTVDFDALRKAQPRGMFDPLAYVTGSMDMTTAGAFAGVDGKGILKIESAALAGVPVPRALLQEVLSFFTRSEEWPQGLALDAPFELPSGIREVQVRKGSATVVQ